MTGRRLSVKDGAGTVADTANPRREAILAAAVELFRDRGFANTTTDEIAAVAGMTKRTMYRHIGSKHRILVDLQDRMIEDVISHHASLDEPGAEPERRLRLFLERHADLVARRSGDVRVLFEEMKYVSPKERVELIARRDEFEANVRRMIKEGVEADRFHVADVAFSASAILGVLNDIRRWDDETVASLGPKLPEIVAKLLFEGLLRTTAPSRQRVDVLPAEVSEPFSTTSSSSSRDDWEVNEVLTDVTTQAARLFHRVGYPSLSTAAIAEATGMTKPALYYYIGRKEELLYRVMRRVLADFVAAQRAVRERGLEGTELLRAAIGAHCVVLVRNIDAVGVLLEEYKFLSPERQQEIRQAEELHLAYLEDAIRHAAAAKSRRVENGHVGALVLAGMLNDMHRWFSPSGRLSEKQISRYIFELFVYGVVGPTESETR
jgi:AcrR family transcriptional regulator